MIWLSDVDQFMDYDVINNFRRGLYQPPAEIDSSLVRA
jgi:hypothetical protein